MAEILEIVRYHACEDGASAVVRQRRLRSSILPYISKGQKFVQIRKRSHERTPRTATHANASISFFAFWQFYDPGIRYVI